MVDFTKWEKEEFAAPPVATARRLLGQYLVHRDGAATYIGRIVETEAYGGTYRRHGDDGCHAFKGLTKRTAPLFQAGGISYVYLIYGMYHCVNAVCGPAGIGQAVLIRAVEPIEGIEAMLVNRKAEKVTPNLTNGPGKLCLAMHITLAQNAVDLTGDVLFVAHPAKRRRFTIEKSVRKNIDYATYGKYFPWRFFIKDNPYVSK